jgi:serine phosphatase RsbU (regulator of sigma subunit)
MIVERSMCKQTIAIRAYEKWQTRGRPWGTHLQDWLEAEAEVRSQEQPGQPTCHEADGRLEQLRADLEQAQTLLGEQTRARRGVEARFHLEHLVTSLLAESSTLTDVTTGILEAIGNTLTWPVGALWSVDRTANVLRCSEFWHAPSAHVPHLEAVSRSMSFAPGTGLPGRVWSGGAPQWLPDLQGGDNAPRASIAIREGLRGACVFPVRLGSEVRGVLEFFGAEMRSLDGDLLDMMANIGTQIALFMERGETERALFERQQEMRLAHKIQQDLLPHTSPHLPGLDIAGDSEPTLETSGDYFDYLQLRDASLGIAIGDASGHGVGAALLMTETRAYLRAFALTDADVSRILTLANRRLAEDIANDYFVTLFLARLDPNSRSLTYASAGHPSGYILATDGAVKTLLPSTGTPLGIDPDADFGGGLALTLNPGEMVLLVTDGILEAQSPEGAVFGSGRVLDVVRAERTRPARQIVESLHQAVQDFVRPMPVSDDITTVVVKVAA